MNKIEIMKTAGQLGKSIFKRIGFILEPGITTQELNDAARRSLEFNEMTAAFKGHENPSIDFPFPSETCISLNSEVCYGVPSSREIGGGDLVSVDIGIRTGDYVVDACQTFEVGEVSEEADHLNYWTKTALKRALRHIRAGVGWNSIACIIQNTAKSKGLGVVRDMTGHGIGKSLHEAPVLRNYMCPENEDIFLEEGQTICVEPMFCLGTGDSKISEDGWTVITADQTLSSHWEHCIVVTQNGCNILL